MDKYFVLFFTLTSTLLCVNCYPSPGVKSLVAFGEVDDDSSQAEAAKVIEAIVLKNLISAFRPELAARIIAASMRPDKRSGE